MNMKNKICLSKTLILMAGIILFLSISFAANAANDIPTIQNDINLAYEKYKNDPKGHVADYIPELGKQNINYCGIAIATVDGQIYECGDSRVAFAIESISKPFAYGLAMQDCGINEVSKKIGLNATGFPFNSVLAIELRKGHYQNPLVNAGAMQVTSLIKGGSSEEKWKRLVNFFNDIAGENLAFDEKIYKSEMATNQHNKAIAELLNSYNLMYSDTSNAVDRYTKACSILVTAKQLACMGATLANGGINPFTQKRILNKESVRYILSEMVVAGLYENSGWWWAEVGLPSKSGVGGGILAIVPGKMAISVFSPLLDKAGNSIRSEEILIELSQKWNLHILSPK